jgi:hypothetical protein
MPPASMPKDRIKFVRPLHIEETAGGFKIIDAKGQHTGAYVYWNDWKSIGANVIRMPEKDQARDIAEAVLKALG